MQNIEFQELYEAYISCRKRKRNTLNALSFEQDLIDNLWDLHTQLNTRNYTPSRSIAFLAYDPKMREIFAADFKDRVVHHWLIPRLEEYYEPRFIYDVYSNRKGKGIHSALKRTQVFMRSVGKKGYYLQCDIKNFFYSIDKTLLLKRLYIDMQKYQVPSREYLFWLSNRIITHNVRDDVHIKGKKIHFKNLPEHKSLLKLPNHLGLPIGNLSSQFFANVYMNAFDNFVKRELKIKHYLRYVDDFVLFHESRDFLEETYEKMTQFLKNELSLTLKEAKLKTLGEGLDFLGYVTRPHYALVRKRVVNNYRYKKSDFLTRFEKSQAKMPLEEIKAFLSVQASFKGHCIHANSYKLMRSVGFIDETQTIQNIQRGIW